MTLGNVGFIGGGNMGSCLIGGLLHQGHSKNKIYVAESNDNTRAQLQEKWGINTSEHINTIIPAVDILVLAVKPQSMRQVVEEFSPTFNANQTLLISIAAGITTAQIQKWIGIPSLPIVRAMPNTPALYGYGMAGLFATQTVEPLKRQYAEQLLQAVGLTVWLEKESLMDVVTALSGSGPAYFFYIIESMIKGAISLGLPSDIASKLTLQTALGSAQMAQLSKENIAKLRENVTSPGGTTEQGIKILKDGKIEDLLLKTLVAATNRGKTLSEQYD